jgi:DNA-binding NtrC family response regulator
MSSRQTASERRSPRFSCVFLGCSEEDYQVASGHLDSAHVRLLPASSIEQADLLLAGGEARVLIAKATFPGGTWQDALALRRTRHPAAVLVVAAEYADERLWLDVLDQGGYDLIVKPFVAEELIRVLANADACARMGAAVRKARQHGLDV